MENETNETAETQESGLDQFTEGGTETAAVVAPVEPKVEEVKPEWDAERQRADQAEANFRKAQQERQELTSKLELAAKSTEALQAKLEEYAKANQVDVGAIDADLVDPKVIAVLKSMQAQVEHANKKVENLETIAKTYEQKQQELTHNEAQEKAKSEIIADVESDLKSEGVGPQHRNQALKEAEAICQKRGYPPTDRYEAAKILRDCYRKAVTKPRPVAKPIPSDTGAAQVAAKPSEEVKPGTLREVMAQHRAKAGLG